MPALNIEAVWRTNNRSDSIARLTNTATGDQSCRKYEMSGDNVKLNGTYEVSQLYVTKTKDEDNNYAYEFKDKLGRVLLQRRTDTSKTTDKEKQCDTYYIYDDFGNLRYVLPPMASDAMDATNTTYIPTNQSVLDYYAYIYRYDGRNRNIVKKLPGCDSVLYVYDKADRLRLSQDGVQRSKNEWTYYKYDALGRQIVTGTFFPITNNATRALMQTNVESNTMLFESLSGSSDGTYKLYTNNSYPKTSDVTNMKELINLYYDNYDFVSSSDFAFTPGVSDSEYDSAKGLQTGSRSALLDESGKYIYRHTRYDAFGRPVQMKSTNTIAGEMDFEYNKYNFTGQVTEKSIKTKTNSVSEKYTYNYDNMGRLQSTWYYLNSDPAKLMDSCTYDMFGRLLTKNTGGIDKTTYSYNVRSWQRKQEGTNLTEELFYTTCPGSNVPVKFGGNIIAKQWTTSKSTAIRGMVYVYDPLDQLIISETDDGSNMTDNSRSYGENLVDHNKNGNIICFYRSGRLDNGSFGTFDIEVPHYHGNQLWEIDEYSTDQNASDLMEFKAGSGQYAYDVNGRLTGDPHKKITNIEYNFVNLPRRITFQDSNKVEYIYDAMGTKFQKKYFTFLTIVDNTGKTTKFPQMFRYDYAANKIYRNFEVNSDNVILSKLLTPEGYVDNVDLWGYNFAHYYYVKDYQGNNRMVLNSTGEIVQATNYYPFGATYAEKPAQDDQSVQPYKYNGKELERIFGLDNYDYSARMYDPIVGRFTTMDPMAEKYPWLSPYAYCANNPVNLIDNNGKQPIPIPIPVLPPPVTTTQTNTISYSDVKNAISYLKQVVAATWSITVQTIKDPQFIGGSTVTSPMILPATASTREGLNNQRNNDRNAKDKLDQQQANVAKSTDTNITGTMPDGNPAPKRDPNDGMKGTKTAAGVVVAAGTVRGIMELKNPDPSKDAAESHQEKAQQQQQQPQQQQNNNQSMWDRFKNWLFN